MNKLCAVLITLWLPALAWAGSVNVNTANAALLSQELDGIGLAKAEAIVKFRSEHGSFETAEELLKVKGIGPKVLDANTGNIQVSD
jgi:competence protein ComEA